MAKAPEKPEDDKTDAQEYQETLLSGQQESTEPEDDTQTQDPVGDEVGGDAGDAADATGSDQVEQGDGEQTQSTEGGDSEFLTALRQLGYEGEDEQQAQMAMLDLLQKSQQNIEQLQSRVDETEELAGYGREYLKAEREKREAEAEREAALKAEQETVEPWWSPPEFDFALLDKYRDVTFDDDGNPTIGWKKGTPREVIETVQAYQEYVDSWATDLVQRPHEVLPKIIEQEFDRLFTERVEERERAAQTASFAEQVMEANRDWMFTTDNQGREVPTEQGQRMMALLDEADAIGIKDPNAAWDHAVARFDYINRQASAAAEEQTESSKKTAAQKREEHEQRATPNNRTGTVPRPEETESLPQNPKESAGRQLLGLLRKHGAEWE